jgi:hypothetical protein
MAIRGIREFRGVVVSQFCGEILSLFRSKAPGQISREGMRACKQAHTSRQYSPYWHRVSQSICGRSAFHFRRTEECGRFPALSCGNRCN